MNSGLGRRKDLRKDASDLFIPEIICMVWQPQRHHPLSAFAKSQAVASWVQNLCEIMFLITRKNGRWAEKREVKEGSGKGGAEGMIDRRYNRRTESNFWLLQKERDHVKPRKKEIKLGSKPGLEGIRLERLYPGLKGRILSRTLRITLWKHFTGAFRRSIQFISS